MDGKTNAEVPADVIRKREQAKDAIEEATDRDSARAEDWFQLGETVWLYDHVRAARLDMKFEPYWSGPYIVVDVPSRHLRLLKNESGREQLAHVDSLQTYRNLNEKELVEQENNRAMSKKKIELTAQGSVLGTGY